jgi:DNA-binding transcriptional MerR regulator
MEITMLLSIGELAAALGVSVVTLRRWDKAG